MKYYFIVNPGSRTGHGRELWNELEAKIIESGIEYEVFFTAGAGDATRIAEQICTEHPEMKRIVIAGGDGTANEAINGLRDYGSFILGYLPTGSSNDLARGLGITQDHFEALDRVLHPKNFRSVDHGVVNYLDDGTAARSFAVSAGIGYDADICYEALTSPLKTFLNRIHLGKLIYYILGVKLIFTNKRARATFTIDGTRKLATSSLLFAAAMNTEYEGGGMPMGPGADPTDGKLTVCIVHDISRLKHMLLMSSIIKAKHIKHKGVELITCSSIEIETDRPLVLHTDGEFAGKHSHVRLECKKEKARMML